MGAAKRKNTTTREAYVQHRGMSRFKSVSLSDLRELVEATKDFSEFSTVEFKSSNNVSVTETKETAWIDADKELI